MSIRMTSPNISTAVENLPAASSRNFESDNRQVFSESSLVPASDSADLSSAAQLVNLARTLGAPARESKISELTLRVASGQYRPSSASISRALVQSCLAS